MDDEILNEDEINEKANNTLGGASRQQNKVCFGVFASMSHSFILKREQHADEISIALQSAFRVLSLTRPEVSILTGMLLKSENFTGYESLACKVNDGFFRVQDKFVKSKDEQFSVTLRDLKRFITAAVALKKAKEQTAIIDLEDKENRLEPYSMERKSKQVVMNEIEKEDTRENKFKNT